MSDADPSTPSPVAHVTIEARINGQPVSRTVRANRTLLEFIRDEVELKGTTEGCGVGVCGCCTVLVDGDPVASCLELAANVDGRTVTTVEGLGRGDDLDPVQEAYKQEEGFQCGYCTPGMLLTTRALLDEHPSPDEDQIEEYLAENLCRCTGYTSIIEAVRTAKRLDGD